jgi:hypothetical protein
VFLIFILKQFNQTRRLFMMKSKFTPLFLFLAILLFVASPTFADRDDDQDNMQNGLKHRVDALEDQVNTIPKGDSCTINGTVVSCEDGTSSDVQGPQGDPGNDGNDGADGVGCTISGSIVTCPNGMSDVRGLQGLAGTDGADGQAGLNGILAGKHYPTDPNHPPTTRTDVEYGEIYRESVYEDGQQDRLDIVLRVNCETLFDIALSGWCHSGAGGAEADHLVAGGITGNSRTDRYSGQSCTWVKSADNLDQFHAAVSCIKVPGQGD